MHRYTLSFLKSLYRMHWYTVKVHIITKRYTVYVIAKLLPNVRL